MQTKSILVWLLMAFCLSRANAQQQSPGLHALLVGVSHYPSLGDKYRLLGPENDVRLFSHLLREKFSFPLEHIRILSEEAGRADPYALPIRANIEREFVRIAKNVAEGDEVVVYFAGHGAQQPELVPGSEIDGLDEIFLPRDVQKWDAEKEIVPNVIVDDEIAAWLRGITNNGAKVWVIFDCCHAGDLSRGLKERERFIRPNDPDGLAIPAKILQRAKGGTDQKDGLRETDLDLRVLKNCAVFYACQSHEKAIELPFDSSKEEKYHGLFSYSLNAVLAKSRRPLTYRQLNREIYREYVAAGRFGGPTPLVEGEGIDRVILGNNVIEKSIRISVDPGDARRRRLLIDAGQLHGITQNSVLAVHSPDVESDRTGALLGYVTVSDVHLASAVVEPCEYEGLQRKTPVKLAKGFCHVVETDYGDLKLPVFVDTPNMAESQFSDQAKRQLIDILGELVATDDSMLKLAANSGKRTWTVRADGEEVFLLEPAQANQEAGSLRSRRNYLGPFSIDDSLKENLSSAFTRIARAENLLRLATTSSAGESDDRDAPRFEIKKQVRSDGEVRESRDIPFLRPGDVFDMSVTNTGKHDFDLTVLYVNSRMGIKPLYPAQNNVNRVRPGQTRKLPLAQFTNGPFGRNHFVFIAVPGKGPNADFNWLTQKSISATRANASPIDALMENLMFGRGRTRSSKSNESCTFVIIPVDVELAKGSKSQF